MGIFKKNQVESAYPLYTSYPLSSKPGSVPELFISQFRYRIWSGSGRQDTAYMSSVRFIVDILFIVDFKMQ